MRLRKALGLLALAAPVAALLIAAPADTPGYNLVKTVLVGGDGGWDYLTLDAAARRLYVSRGNRVMVFDADTFLSVGAIPDTSGVHGVALAPEFSRGFTSNGRGNSVTIFNMKTLKTISEVKVTGENPDAILYDPATKRVFTFNGRTANATVLDAATGAVAGTIALDGKPEFGVADGKGLSFVNIEDKNEIEVLDGAKLSVVKKFPLAPCEEPSGLAIDREHRRLFAGCHNKIMAVVDADSGKVVAMVPIGEGVDANAYDPGTGLAFASCGDGTLTAARSDGGTWSVAQTVTTQQGARTMALDEKTHRIVLVTAQFGPPPSPTAENPRPRRPIVAGSFVLLVVGN